MIPTPILATAENSNKHPSNYRNNYPQSNITSLFVDTFGPNLTEPTIISKVRAIHRLIIKTIVNVIIMNLPMSFFITTIHNSPIRISHVVAKYMPCINHTNQTQHSDNDENRFHSELDNYF